MLDAYKQDLGQKAEPVKMEKQEEQKQALPKRESKYGNLRKTSTNNVKALAQNNQKRPSMGVPKPIEKKDGKENKQMGNTAKDFQPEVRKGFGKVPKYLQKFNEQRDEQAHERAMEEERKQYPPGTRKMDQDERLKLLEELKKTKEQNLILAEVKNVIGE